MTQRLMVESQSYALWIDERKKSSETGCLHIFNVYMCVSVHCRVKKNWWNIKVCWAPCENIDFWPHGHGHAINVLKCFRLHTHANTFTLPPSVFSMSHWTNRYLEYWLEFTWCHCNWIIEWIFFSLWARLRTGLLWIF